MQLRKVQATSMKLSLTLTPTRQLFKKLTLRPEANSNPLRIPITSHQPLSILLLSSSQFLLFFSITFSTMAIVFHPPAHIPQVHCKWGHAIISVIFATKHLAPNQNSITIERLRMEAIHALDAKQFKYRQLVEMAIWPKNECTNKKKSR
jgi:hypothetical protein